MVELTYPGVDKETVVRPNARSLALRQTCCMAAEQIEMTMSVPVCAWCRRKASHPPVPASEISHGICPRHLKIFKAELQVLKGEASPTPKPVIRRLRTGEPKSDPFLPLEMDITAFDAPSKRGTSTALALR